MEKPKIDSTPLIAALLTLLYVFLIFHPIFLHPNMYMLTNGGDGLKNYFTAAWFVRYDTGAHFTGMNYPFGEHVTFTDNQPMVSWVLSFIKHIIHIDNKVVGIMNLMMLISPCITAFFLSLILKRFNVNGIVNIVYALALALLEPQFMRVLGHFALAYGWIFPAYWWLMISYYNTGKYKYALWGFIFLTCAGFVHLYNIFVCAMFGGVFFMVHAIVNRHKQELIKNVIWLGVNVLPFIIYLVFLKVTDMDTDRPPAPWGFLFYTSNLQGVFLPNDFCYLHDLTNKIPDLSWHWEGMAYVGIAGVFSAMMVLIRGVYFVAVRKDFLFTMPAMLSLYMLAGCIVYLISTGFPFNWPLQNYMDHFSMVRQFRSLGRLSWVFYYVLTIYGAVFFYNVFNYLRPTKPELSALPLFAVLCAWLIDGSVYAYNVSRSGVGLSNVFLLNKPGIDSTELAKYQAILALPFFSEGSEKFYTEQDMNLTGQSMIMAVQTHLPIIDGMMSRTSFGKTAQLLRLVGSPIIPMPRDIHFNPKPILLLIKPDVPLTVVEKMYKDKSTLVKHLEAGYDAYCLPSDVFEKTHKLYMDTVQTLLLHIGNASYVTQNGLPVVTSRLVNPNVKESILDSSLCHGIKGEYAGFNDTLPRFFNGKKCHVSWWYKVYQADEGFPLSWFEMQDKDGKTLYRKDFATKYSRDYYKGWLRVEYVFDYVAGAKVRISGEGQHVTINSVVIQADGTHLAEKDSKGHTWYDNYPVFE